MMLKSGGVGRGGGRVLPNESRFFSKADKSVGASKDTNEGSGKLFGVSGPTANTRVDLDCPRTSTHDKKHPVHLG